MFWLCECVLDGLGWGCEPTQDLRPGVIKLRTGGLVPILRNSCRSQKKTLAKNPDVVPFPAVPFPVRLAVPFPVRLRSRVGGAALRSTLRRTQCSIGGTVILVRQEDAMQALQIIEEYRRTPAGEIQRKKLARLPKTDSRN